MILGVPGTDLALTQRLVSLSGPRKESTRMLPYRVQKVPIRALYPLTLQAAAAAQ